MRYMGMDDAYRKGERYKLALVESWKAGTDEHMAACGESYNVFCKTLGQV